MRRGIRERLADALGVSKEIVMDLPHITFAGNREVYIENYKSIIEYTDTVIRLLTADGTLSIKGRELSIDMVRVSDMFVSGYFDIVEFKSI